VTPARGKYFHRQTSARRMQEPRRLAVGTLLLAGEEMDFEPAPNASFTARPGERLEILVDYHYTEPSRDEDRTRIVVAAELGGAKLGSVETEIDDEKLLDDSHRSYLTVPFLAPSPGTHPGVVSVKVVYTRAGWGARKGESESATLDRAVPFTLRVA